MDNLFDNNMIKLLFRGHSLFSVFRFKLSHYSFEDYATMCGLLREKYQLHNEEIQTSGLVKLLDQEGNVIGVYTASEARKKSQNLGLDMVMVNLKSTPVVCKAVDFRKRLLDRFYDQIVVRSTKQNISKATSTKSIKISPNLNKNEMTVKIKQVVELSQKFSKIRIFMTARSVNKEDCLSKLEEIKSQLLNKCYIEEQISSSRFQLEGEDEDEEPKVQTTTLSFVVRARENDLPTRPHDEKKTPDGVLKIFLKKYYSQEDGEMMDLKSAGLFQVDEGINLDNLDVKQPSVSKNANKNDNVFSQNQLNGESQFDQSMQREAEARVLNKRLKVLLSLSL